MSNRFTIPYAALNLEFLMNATGQMQYTLTNDYLFHVTFQKSNKALKGLVCSLQGLKPEEVKSVEIVNPIELGRSIDAKDFILDIKVLLNDNTLINLELQIINYGNWPERSLGYLCRSYDHLNRGEDYKDTKQVVQISFLNFTLFRDAPEFFSNYMLMNVKNFMIYSDKIRLSVVDLTQIEKATEEDELRGIVYWARLFKATTWEEIKMLAEKNEFLEEAAVTLRELSADEKVRQQCEAREDFYKQQRYIQWRQEQLEYDCRKAQERTAQLEEEANRLKANNNELEAKALQLRESNAGLEAETRQLRESNAGLEAEALKLREELRRLKEKPAMQK